MKYELKATRQKSYYGKAHVTEEENIATLTSYTTDVCKIEKGNFIKLWNGYSSTTAKHINDFRNAYGLPSINKKEWDNLPCENTEKYRIAMDNCYTGQTYKAQTVFDNYEDAENYADSISEGFRQWYVVEA